MGHALFVVAAPGREAVVGSGKGLSETGDIAMSEDRPASRDHRVAVFVLLGAQVADHGLRGGEADRAHAGIP